MHMTVTWDPRKAKSNYEKHGVRFSDAESVLWDPHGMTIENGGAKGEQRLVTIGSDSVGSVLVVVFTFENDLIRLLSARKATRRERKTYEEGI